MWKDAPRIEPPAAAKYVSLLRSHHSRPSAPGRTRLRASATGGQLFGPLLSCSEARPPWDADQWSALPDDRAQKPKASCPAAATDIVACPEDHPDALGTLDRARSAADVPGCGLCASEYGRRRGDHGDDVLLIHPRSDVRTSSQPQDHDELRASFSRRPADRCGSRSSRSPGRWRRPWTAPSRARRRRGRRRRPPTSQPNDVASPRPRRLCACRAGRR